MPSLPINLDLIRSRSTDIRSEIEMLRAHTALPVDMVLLNDAPLGLRMYETC